MNFRILFLAQMCLGGNVTDLKPKPSDIYDKIMARRDAEIEGLKEENNPNAIKKQDPYVESVKKQEKLEKQAQALRKILKAKNIHPITSHNLWEQIYKYIEKHIVEYLENSHFSFSFPIRYGFCSFIIPLTPIEKTLIFPAFYKFLIPKKLTKIKLVEDFVKSFDNFLNMIKKKSQTELLITVTLKRETNGLKDLEMIKKIPDLVKSDPLKIIAWAFDFKADTLRFNPLDEVVKLDKE